MGHPGVACLALIMAMSCTSPPPPDATGEEIYVEVCSSCHGVDLSGGIAPPVGPGSNSATQSDEFLELTITRGRGRMPAFGSVLSENQVDRLVEFLRERQG
ncbi:MAG: cytochrome c [Acidimicrobiia bacterium]|nr:cytochrome c [Acidimicrobiia bacterium]